MSDQSEQTRQSASRLLLRAVPLAALGVLAAACAAVAWLPAGEDTLGSYATSLRGRTRSQAFNALRAARALNGTVLQPGETFSFNRKVGPWNAAAGYRKAPVSYDGELLRSYGGGVCQTSTTLYNAVLVAGLEVVERHSHVRPPTYVAPGRDAAVAMPEIDLRFRNPYAHAVTLEARSVGDSLVISVKGRGPRRARAVATEVQAVDEPPVVRSMGTPNPGRAGFTSLTYVSTGGGKRRVLAHDAYPPVSRLEP